MIQFSVDYSSKQSVGKKTQLGFSESVVSVSVSFTWSQEGNGSSAYGLTRNSRAAS